MTEKRPVYTTLSDRDAKPKLKSRLRVIPDVLPGRHRARSADPGKHRAKGND